MKRFAIGLSVLALLTSNAWMLKKYIYYKNAHRDSQSMLRSIIGENLTPDSPATAAQMLLERIRFLEFVEFATRYHSPDFHATLRATLRSSRTHDLNPYLILSLIYLESGFNPQAVSFKGACGLMQINYVVWKDEMKLDYKRIFEIDYNVEIGCRILRHYLDRAGGDMARALYLYNNGYNENGNRKYSRLVLQGKFSKEPALTTG